jgi:hypothetical protein
MTRFVTVILIYLRHKPIDRINLLGSQQRRNVLPVRYEHYALYDINKRLDDEHRRDL